MKTHLVPSPYKNCVDKVISIAPFLGFTNGYSEQNFNHSSVNFDKINHELNFFEKLLSTRGSKYKTADFLNMALAVGINLFDKPQLFNPADLIGITTGNVAALPSTVGLTNVLPFAFGTSSPIDDASFSVPLHTAGLRVAGTLYDKVFISTNGIISFGKGFNWMPTLGPDDDNSPYPYFSIRPYHDLYLHSCLTTVGANSTRIRLKFTKYPVTATTNSFDVDILFFTKTNGDQLMQLIFPAIHVSNFNSVSTVLQFDTGRPTGNMRKIVYYGTLFPDQAKSFVISIDKSEMVSSTDMPPAISYLEGHLNNVPGEGQPEGPYGGFNENVSPNDAFVGDFDTEDLYNYPSEPEDAAFYNPTLNNK